MMRKNYVYAITIILLVLSLWAGYYLYSQYQPVVYENGTFVEFPVENVKDTMELCA